MNIYNEFKEIFNRIAFEQVYKALRANQLVVKVEGFAGYFEPIEYNPADYSVYLKSMRNQLLIVKTSLAAIEFFEVDELPEPDKYVYFVREKYLI